MKSNLTQRNKSMTGSEAKEWFIETATDSFAKTLEIGQERYRFSSDDFSNEWFRWCGHAYVFIFRESLEVTNIQIAELLALITQHATFCKEKENKNEDKALFFNTQKDFNEAINRFVAGVVNTDLSEKAINENTDAIGIIKKHITMVADNYWDAISRSAVTEIYQQTCIVYLPPNVDIDTSKICSDAGYVFSCGKLVHTINSNQSDYNAFEKSLKDFIKDNSINKAILRLHSIEKYPTGIDNLSDLQKLKIIERKAVFGGLYFPDMLRRILTEFGESLVTDGSKDVVDATLWMYTDRGCEIQNTMKPSDDRYYILYRQEFINNNPLHCFDENKPGWISQTTIPHPLYRAMINITKPWNKPQINIYDPFAGTLTGLFESIGHHDSEVNFYGSDKEEVLSLAWKDNCEFFSDIKNAETACRVFAALTKPNMGQKKYLKPLGIINKLIPAEDDGEEDNMGTSAHIELTADIITELSKLNYKDRIAFWVMLRARRRFSKMPDIHEDEAYNNELMQQARKLLDQTRVYIDWHLLPSNEQIHPIDNAYRISKTNNSASISYSPDHLKLLMQYYSNNNRIIFGGDADILTLEISDLTQPDIVITDPPYSFNTNEDLTILLSVYKTAIYKSIKELNNDGHLVICVPDKSYVGKPLPFFTMPELVTLEVLTAAATLNKRIYLIAKSLPTPRNFFMPPYYWHSQVALKRSILHFRIGSGLH